MLDDSLGDIVAKLPKGRTLTKAYPHEFQTSAPVAASSTSSPVLPVVVAPLSSPPVLAVSAPTQPLLLGTSSRSCGPLPVLVPTHTASRSPASVSPVLTAPSPDIPPALSRSPSTGSGVGAALPSSQGSVLPAPSLPVPSLPAGGTRPRQVGPPVLAADTSKVPRVVRLFLFLRLLFIYPAFLV